MTAIRPSPDPCQHWDGAEQRRCDSWDGVRMYIIGPRCLLHTPNAIAGKPEAPEVDPPKRRHLSVVRN
ncbi:hypothetical protein ACPPVO_43555 [Dactylosporangium sp. McL0621]|uniref:hypothetical protein n=1 Tax=Dactylosporangium sp. McL0621 TaxID=3415678 RepID=UPI003CF94019